MKKPGFSDVKMSTWEGNFEGKFLTEINAWVILLAGFVSPRGCSKKSVSHVNFFFFYFILKLSVSAVPWNFVFAAVLFSRMDLKPSLSTFDSLFIGRTCWSVMIRRLWYLNGNIPLSTLERAASSSLSSSSTS